MSLGRYGRIVRAPGAAHVFGGLTFSRVALGGTGLMTLLFVRAQTDSYAAAGAVVAAYTVATGIMSPVYGRMADRRGQTLVILAPVAPFVVAMGALIAAGTHHAQTGVLVVCALVGGAFLPPVSAFVRPLLPTVIGASDPEALSAAYAFDAILIEVGFISGPLIGTLIISLFSPAAALGTMVVFVLAGALTFASADASRRWRPGNTETHRSSPLRARGLQTLLAAALSVGVTFGSLEVALPAFAAAHGAAHAAGLLLALVSLASAAGGLAFGARAGAERALSLDYMLLLLAIPAAFALMLVANSIAVMAAFVVIAGATIAPLVAAQNELVPALSPAGAITESYTWMSLALTAGVAGGAAVAGVLVDAHGWRAAVICGCIVTAIGGLVTVTRRRTLTPA